MKYARKPVDVDDLMQAGRIAVWQELEKHKDRNRSYVIQLIDWRIQDEAKRIYRNQEEQYSPIQEELLYSSDTEMDN